MVAFDMNNKHLLPFHADEIRASLFIYILSNLLGLMVCKLCFSKSIDILWVTKACLKFLNAIGHLRYLNHTLVALILNVMLPTMLSKFRLVRLYNVLYKIIAKTLANRFKKVLPFYYF